MRLACGLVILSACSWLAVTAPASDTVAGDCSTGKTAPILDTVNAVPATIIATVADVIGLSAQ